MMIKRKALTEQGQRLKSILDERAYKNSEINANIQIFFNILYACKYNVYQVVIRVIIPDLIANVKYLITLSKHIVGYSKQASFYRSTVYFFQHIGGVKWKI